MASIDGTNGSLGASRDDNSPQAANPERPTAPPPAWMSTPIFSDAEISEPHMSEVERRMRAARAAEARVVNGQPQLDEDISLLPDWNEDLDPPTVDLGPEMGLEGSFDMTEETNLGLEPGERNLPELDQPALDQIDLNEVREGTVDTRYAEVETASGERVIDLSEQARRAERGSFDG